MISYGDLGMKFSVFFFFLLLHIPVFYFFKNIK
jgi:hypothetical protein